MASLIKFNKIALAKASYRICSRSNYYFVLPEVPSDTPETNPLMRNEPLPSINELDYKKIQNGFNKLAINFDNYFNKIVENSTADKTEKNFDDIFPVLEKSFAPLDSAYKTARHLAFIAPYSKNYLGFSKIQSKMGSHKDERWANKNFYLLLKQLESSKHLLTEAQCNYLERSLRYCKLNGLHFNEADQAVCTGLNNKIIEHQSYFKQRLNYANKTFELRLSAAMPMDEIPIRIKKMIAVDPANPNKGPWSVIPNEEVFKSFMKYCSNRNLRKTFYEGFYSRASYVNEQNETNNSEIVKKIINYRQDQAKLFNYQNYAQMAIESKAAVSVENVYELINKIKVNLKPVADESLAKLQKYSATEGNLTPFEAYDVEFWRTKHTNNYFKVDHARVQQYFPLQKVINGLFDLSKLLFNVEFKKDESIDKEKHLWDPNVSSYNVIDENGKHISTLLLDPFLRSRKINNIWSYSGRDSSQIADMKPIAYLIMNAVNLGSSTLLSFEQVKTLFSEFGKVIQILLTQTPYVELSDHNSVESDAFGLSKKLFDRLLFVPEVMKMISAHQNTGEPIPVEMLNRLKHGNGNLKIFQLMSQTYLSAFDIECHISDKFWPEVSDELWSKFMSVPLLKNDFRACQFESTFGENFACLYYSHLWSDMLSADLYEAFKDVGFEDKSKIQEVGRRFRDTFLVNGSSLKSNEMFRQFRGRNPSMEPFLKSFNKNQKF